MVGTPSVARRAPVAFAHPTSSHLFSVIPGHANGPRQARLDGVNPESSLRAVLLDSGFAPKRRAPE